MAGVECLCGVKVSQVHSICVRWTSSVWQANRDISTSKCPLCLGDLSLVVVDIAGVPGIRVGFKGHED